jgi:hypothetical protein
VWTYKLRYVRCGKWNCRCGQGGIGHGPYWYGYEHRGGRVRSKYFGKRPTSAGWTGDTGSARADVDPPQSNLWDRYAFFGKMDQRTAFRIFGYRYATETGDLVKRYRALAMQHHPDLGGDTQVMAAINAAYAWLKGWLK